MTPKAAKRIRIAGYLHDIGKVSVSNEILEKPGPLDLEEWRVMRAHSYHTHHILRRAGSLGEIVDWAAHHHECPNGSGYPFRRADGEVSLGARVVIVADIFTALSEDRPYRQGMNQAAICDVLREMADEGKIDRRVSDTLIANVDHIRDVRVDAQSAEAAAFADFWRTARDGVA